MLVIIKLYSVIYRIELITPIKNAIFCCDCPSVRLSSKKCEYKKLDDIETKTSQSIHKLFLILLMLCVSTVAALPQF